MSARLTGCVMALLLAALWLGTVFGPDPGSAWPLSAVATALGVFAVLWAVRRARREQADGTKHLVLKLPRTPSRREWLLLALVFSATVLCAALGHGHVRQVADSVLVFWLVCSPVLIWLSVRGRDPGGFV